MVYNSIAEDPARVKEPDSEVVSRVTPESMNEDLNKTKVIADFFNNIIIPIFAYSEKDTKFVNMESNSYMTSFEYVKNIRMEINKQEQVKIEDDEPFTDEELHRIFVGSGVSIDDLKQTTEPTNGVTKMSLFDE